MCTCVCVCVGLRLQIDDATFSLSVAKDVLDYYDNVFGIRYALPKLDLIAIPDFAAGAMENW